MPISPLLASLQLLAAADPLCLADEVAFLGVAALQSACIDEREALLDVVGRTLKATPRQDAGAPAKTLSSDRDRVRAWSVELLVYPVVSMAAAGNAAAAEVLQLLEAALGDISCRGTATRVDPTSAQQQEGHASTAGGKSLRYCSAVALGVRRLSMLEDDEEAMVSCCDGLQRHADELLRARGDGIDGAVQAATCEQLESGLCLLAPLVLRPHGKRAHSAACSTLVSVVRAVPSLGVRLLPFVLYAIRTLGSVGAEGGGVVCLEILPELGRHKVAVKRVTGVIQALAKAPQAVVRGVGFRLAAALIQVNSRYFCYCIFAAF